MIKKILRVVLPFLVLAVGVAALVALIKTKPKAVKQARDDRGAVVEVISVAPGRERIKVKAHGTVVPARQVVISPEVGGRVVWMADELVPGGRFTKGQKMFRIDSRDYRLLVEQQYAAVDRARTELEIERGRKKIAEHEWDLMRKGEDKAEGKSSLALRDPQLRTAEVGVTAANSGLRRARINIGRTVVPAPFNAMVQQRKVDVGQIVGPASPAVTMVGTDEFWVQVSVPVDRLAWIDVPGVNGVTKGSRATVWREIGGKRVERDARVIRLMGDVDPMGRMARLLIEIEDPLGIDKQSTPTLVGEATVPPLQLPLLVGSFVQVSIDGKQVDHVVELPREALHDGDSVYVMAGERVELIPSLKGLVFWVDRDEMEELATINTLEIRKVHVVWRMLNAVYVDSGLRAGDLVITSPVPAPISGMKLRTIDPLGVGADDGSETASVETP